MIFRRFAIQNQWANYLSLFTTEFNDWGKGYENIVAHRKSPQHRNAVSAAIIRRKINCRIDKSLIVELETETKYWCNVLFRVLDVLKFLCERRLTIRVKDESIGPYIIVIIFELYSCYVNMIRSDKNILIYIYMVIKEKGQHHTYLIVFVRN